MERLRNVPLPSRNSGYTPEGTKINVMKLNFLEEGESPGSVPEHEIAHAGVAIKTGTPVIDATIVPGRGYLGLTRLTSVNTAALIAPEAEGFVGTGSDVFKYEMLGGSPSDVIVARRIASTHKKGFHRAASLLQKKKTMTGAEIERAIKEGDEGERVLVEFIKSDGEKNKIEHNASEDIVSVPNAWLVPDVEDTEPNNPIPLFPGIEAELPKA